MKYFYFFENEKGRNANEPLPSDGERLIRSKSRFGLPSDGPRDLTAAQAAGARINVLRGTVDDGLDALDVGLPHAVGTTMRVAHLDTEGNALVTELTLRHAYCTSLWIWSAQWAAHI